MGKKMSSWMLALQIIKILRIWSQAWGMYSKEGECSLPFTLLPPNINFNTACTHSHASKLLHYTIADAAVSGDGAICCKLPFYHFGLIQFE
jgi:hypothetical protein